MKAVIYARYSSDSQREESIDGQIRECTAFAEKNGITILRHYIDRACSAKTDNRPAFQEMVKDSVKKLFDMVIVWKLDRFARNRYDSARYKAQLKKNGVKVVSATEVISEGAEGIILESVLEGYAEYYSADLSEKVIRGRTDNALKCMYNGGTLPIGFVIDEEQHFQIDPLTAPFVLEVFKRYDEGATMKELRDWLNENGIRNKLGKPLNYNSMAHVGIIGEMPEVSGKGRILVATGGTSDIPVAEEAALTAEALGNDVLRLYDVGVSGIHRLLSHMDIVMSARVIIAVAGMEGALPSVVGGLVDCPVIAVPTSGGYGAACGGVAALVSMLNSCASGMSVVNIDNGFGAGYLASMINHMD